MIEVEVVNEERLGDLEALFGCEEMTERCWCMWFIRPVKEFHEVGSEGNRADFVELAGSSSRPMGLIAYDGAQPVGWAAVGPRNRYERMLRSPTLRERDRSEDGSVWLVPCFFVHPGHRGSGVASALLGRAIELADEYGATAIEGFPLAGRKRRSGGSDFQTGVEPLFAAHGFVAVHRPSANRVIMRTELPGGGS